MWQMSIRTDKRKRENRTAKIRVVKPEIRVLGIDDGVFTPHSDKLVDVVGVVYRGGYWFDGFMHTRVRVDGLDATEKLAEMIVASPHYRQLRVVMLNGVTLAGFNVVDIEALWRRTGLPVVAVTRDEPNFDDIKKALKNLSFSEERWRAIGKAGKMMKVRTRAGESPIFVHAVGLSESVAKQILRGTCTRSNVPEALRVAHLIASGLTPSGS
jgi:endonuclease V-like protein UPF0215 family